MCACRKLKGSIEATPGEKMVVEKCQLLAMLGEIELGNHARRSLTNLQSQLTVATATSGMRVSDGYRAPIAPLNG